MTRDEILKFEGKDLRRAIAVDIMKLKNVREAEGGEYIGRFDFAEPGDLIYDIEAIGTWDTAYVPDYPNDISSAWGAEQKIFERGITRKGLLDAYMNALEEIVFRENKLTNMFDTLHVFFMTHATPSQKCKAALLAVMEQE